MQDAPVSETNIAELLKNIVAATRLDLDFAILQHPGSVPDLTIEFTGPDTRYLIARNAELLHAIEHLAAKVRGLQPEQYDLLSCDADQFKQTRDHTLRVSAHRAATRVRETGAPYAFPPMSSHERRQLHLLLTPLGLETASAGEGRERHVVLYPPRNRP